MAQSDKRRKGEINGDLASGHLSISDSDIMYIANFIDDVKQTMHIDHMRIRFYLSTCDNKRAEKDNTYMIQLEPTSRDIIKNLQSYVEGLGVGQNIIGRLSEHGVNDTFVRISSVATEGIQDNRKIIRNFFRRRVYVVRSQSDYGGIVLLELFTMCEEEDLPYLSQYEHNNIYNTTTYTIQDNQPYRICFTEFVQNRKDSSKNEIYVDVNIDIDFVKDDVKKQLCSFFKTVDVLKTYVS